MFNVNQKDIRVRCTKNRNLYNTIQRMDIRYTSEKGEIKNSLAFCASYERCPQCSACIDHVHQMLDAGFPIGTEKVLEPTAKPQEP